MTDKAPKTKAPASQFPSPANEAAVPCKTRFLCALQSTGRVGKSTAIQSLASYLDFAGVLWAGVDADPEHRTFSSAFANVAHFPLSTPENLDQIFRHADTAPVSLVDFPAGSTETILDHLKRRQVLVGFGERGVRMTVLLFASPDPTAEASFRAVFATLKGQVDFILVQNDARFSSVRFASSPAAKALAELGAPTVTLPALSSLSLREVAQAEGKLRRRLPLAEARQHVGTDSRLDLDYFTNQVWAQWEEHADLIVPDPKLILHRLERAVEPANAPGAGYDEFADPLDL